MRTSLVDNSDAHEMQELILQVTQGTSDILFCIHRMKPSAKHYELLVSIVNGFAEAAAELKKGVR